MTNMAIVVIFDAMVNAHKAMTGTLADEVIE